MCFKHPNGDCLNCHNNISQSQCIYKFISHSFGDQKKFIIKVLANLASDKNLTGLPSGCIRSWPLLCALWRKRASSLVSLLSRTIILLDQGPTFVNLVNLNYFFRGPTSKYSHAGSQSFKHKFQGDINIQFRREILIRQWKNKSWIWERYLDYKYKAYI